MTTSENSGPKTGTATSPELDEDLDITNVRIGVVPGSGSTGSAASGAGSAGAGEIPEPAAVQEKTTAERVDDLDEPKAATGPGSTGSRGGAARTEPAPKAPQPAAPESRPVESKPAESKPVESKPAESKAAAEASPALTSAEPTPPPPAPAPLRPAAHESAPSSSPASAASTGRDAKPAGSPTPGTSPSGLSSPVPPSAPSTGSSSSSSTSGVPVQGGIWRSAYAAGDSSQAATVPSTSAPGPAAANGFASGRTAVPPVPPPPSANPFDTVSTNAGSGNGAPGRSAAGAVPGTAPGASPAREPWNRPVQPTTSSGVPAAEGEGDEASSPLADAAAGVKAGAVKAAAAALAAARSAAKKVSSVLPESNSDQAPAPAAQGSRPEMHYAAGGVRGTAVPVGVPVGAPGVGAPGGIPGGAPGAGGVPSPGAVPPGVAQPQSGQLPRVPAGPRRVRLAVSRVDPWSVMKLAFLLSVAVAIMVVVATGVFWSVLNNLGVFVRVEDFVANAIGPQYDVTTLTQYFEMNRWLSLATLVAICNIILTTALATLVAFLYNITAALVGGVHMTLTDD